MLPLTQKPLAPRQTISWGTLSVLPRNPHQSLSILLLYIKQTLNSTAPVTPSPSIILKLKRNKDTVSSSSCVHSSCYQWVSSLFHFFHLFCDLCMLLQISSIFVFTFSYIFFYIQVLGRLRLALMVCIWMIASVFMFFNVSLS